MKIKGFLASLTVALAVAMALGSSLFSLSERQDGASERVILPAHSTPRTFSGRDEVIFNEDFENDAEGWETYDLTNPDTVWHKSDFLGQEDDLSWWAGDTITGYNNPYYGYDNIWLQYLETPVLDLSGAHASVTLEFDARWLLEDPRRVPPPQGWDGWDGWLVLISTNGGEDFSVIRPESPEYTAEHLSAAERFWMLEGDWPGWVFESKEGGREAWDDSTDQTPEPEWVHCTFDLSDHRADAVVVRFMIVTDRTVSSVFSADGEGNQYLANGGVSIDNVIIADEANHTYLTNNADDDPHPSDLIPVRGAGFGDSWMLTRENVHTGTWAMWNDDDNFNVVNALDSPPIEIPDSSNCHLEYWVRCDLPDAVHQGSQNLSDFYQIYVSDDDRATWVYFTHDYNRAGAGGDQWDLYGPGVPFAGNLDLAFTDFVGETIRIRWLFRTDNDHREGNGSGLRLDDIQVINQNRQNRDAGFDRLYIPYPTTVRYRLNGLTALMINYGLRDLSQIWSYWGWRNEEYGLEHRILPYPSVDADDSLSINLTDYVDRRNPGWTPVNPGSFIAYARTTVGAQTPQDNSDDDQNPRNDSTSLGNLRVWPEELFELGYDNRTIRFRYEFASGTGPATRFTPAGGNINRYTLAFAHLLFNGGQDGDATFRLHILRGGDEDTPGQEIAAVDVTVPPDSCLPNSMTVPLSHIEALRNLQGEFWLWAEIRRDDGRPQIIGDELRRGEGRYYRYDGRQTSVHNADLMMHAAIIPAGNVAPNLVGVEDLFDFGDVTPGQSALRYFSLHCNSQNPVTIQSVSVNENSFDVDWPGEVTLTTGQSVRFAMTFSPPDAQVHAGELVIESNDETPPEITIAGSGSVSVGGERPPAPRGFALASPYPNPFNGTARFQFSLDRAGDAAITLHDLAGRRVADIANGWFEAGINAGVIRASDLPAGVYLLKLDSDNRTALQKIVLVK